MKALSRIESVITACIALLASALPLEATEFNILVLDAAGTGFNDSSPADPVGGNTGTTLGQQRLNVLQRAGEIWAGYLQSEVPITVEARFLSFGGDEVSGAVLAGASSLSQQADFANAPQPGVYYPVALANSLAGQDLEPATRDIRVQVNLSVDTDGLFGGFYYGLDGAADGQVDLLDVLLHELGHGLGFVSFFDRNSGNFLNNTPDIYSLQLFDTETDLGWGEMKSKERKDSSINDPDLVWTGPYTTAALGQILEQQLAVVVDQPPDFGSELAYATAEFGPVVPVEGLSGVLVVADDGVDPFGDACEPIPLNGSLTGRIALIDRGTCTFDSKVLNAQQAGAIAVIIANNVTGGPVGMATSGEVDTSLITIPAVSISLEDGQALKVLSGEVQVTIGVPSSLGLSGTSAGFLRIFAPNPFEQGSSVSHFSSAAFPDLLMEPNINPDLRDDLDFSLTVMKDIGWDVTGIPYPYLDYNLWVELNFDPADSLTAPGDDPELDGLINIEEYFFGGDPKVASTDVLPRMEVGVGDTELVYTRSLLGADLSYAYEVSGDAVSWSDAVEGIDYSAESVTSAGPSLEQVRVQVLPPPPGGKVFLRLRINLP